ncbi:MAG TPA: isochorismate synthase [Steroidobacteraceae bacterium]|nr:isochorismate synthase [Steroidobacteraceae bacterium]
MSSTARAFRSEPCLPLDPLEVFAAAAGTSRFYWEQPAAKRFRVGVGCAARVTVAGHARFREADVTARQIFAGLRWEGPGPRLGHLVGGFAFAPDGDGHGIWNGFPDGELQLPELVYWREGDEYVRDACLDSRWATLQPRPLALGQPVHGLAEIGNGGSDIYVERVQHAIDAIHAGSFDKVVVAREVHVEAGASIDPVAWLVALRERFPTCTLFAIDAGEAVFLGATPERLVRVHGASVETVALAGTAPRGASAAADRALGEALCDSRKNGQEHAFVVQHLRTALAACCDDVEYDPEPRLLRTRTVMHLRTDLRARRRAAAPASLLELVERLHPTPAVGGLPRDPALAWLAEHEGLERGWFAGPIGYLQANGDGEFDVALRSALVRGRAATAWAGAGIVARSQPRAEFTETELKLRAVLGPLLWGAP